MEDKLLNSIIKIDTAKNEFCNYFRLAKTRVSMAPRSLSISMGFWFISVNMINVDMRMNVAQLAWEVLKILNLH